MGRPWPTGGSCAKKKEKKKNRIAWCKFLPHQGKYSDMARNWVLSVRNTESGYLALVIFNEVSRTNFHFHFHFNRINANWTNFTQHGNSTRILLIYITYYLLEFRPSGLVDMYRYFIDKYLPNIRRHFQRHRHIQKHSSETLKNVENVAWLCQATFSTQCTQLANRLSSFTRATTGQTTIGSGKQSDLLMMGIKMPETCWDT